MVNHRRFKARSCDFVRVRVCPRLPIRRRGRAKRAERVVVSWDYFSSCSA